MDEDDDDDHDDDDDDDDDDGKGVMSSKQVSPVVHYVQDRAVRP